MVSLSKKVAVCTSLLVLASVLSSCGQDSDSEPATAETTTVTVTAEPPPATQDSSPVSEESTAPADEALSSPSADGPTVLAPDKDRDRDLTLFDVFAQSPEDGWQEDRYDVASTKGIKGIATETSECYDSADSQMEFRLANGFNDFNFKAGQANSSESSEETLKIEVYGDGKQLDVKNVPFNREVEISVDVGGVNALQVRASQDEDKSSCSEDLTAVFYSIRLS